MRQYVAAHVKHPKDAYIVQGIAQYTKHPSIYQFVYLSIYLSISPLSIYLNIYTYMSVNTPKYRRGVVWQAHFRSKDWCLPRYNLELSCYTMPLCLSRNIFHISISILKIWPLKGTMVKICDNKKSSKNKHLVQNAVTKSFPPTNQSFQISFVVQDFPY